MALPKIYPLAEVCQQYLPQGRDAIKNKARIQPDGSYLSVLGGGQSLRLVKLGARFAVVESDLQDFLRRAGVRIEAPAAEAAANPTPAAPRRGRPRKAAHTRGAA